MERTPSVVTFAFEVDNLYDAYGSDRGFSPHMFALWLRDPEAGGGTTSALDDLGLTAEFTDPWQYRLEVSGFTKSAVDAGGAPLTDGEDNAVDPQVDVDTGASVVSLSIDDAAFDGSDIEEMELVAMVQVEEFGTLRGVAETADGGTFGGARSGAVENAPRVMDLLTPDGTAQAEALEYDADRPATLPFVSLATDAAR